MLPPSPTSPAQSVPLDARCAAHADRPAHAECSKCRGFACAPCTVVEASGAVLCAACSEGAVGTLPWERRGELGWARAFVATVLGAMGRPAEFFAQRSRERAVWPALLFGLVLHTYAGLASMAITLAFADRIRADLLRAGVLSDERLALLAGLLSNEMIVVEGLASPLLFVLGTAASVALWWIGFRLTGGLARPLHTIVRAVCYSKAPLVFVPLVALVSHAGAIGSVLSMGFSAWMVSIQIIAVSRMQGVSVVRGLTAFLCAMALVGIAFCVLSAVLGALLATQIRIPGL